MKQCPQCKKTYADYTLNFCLDDGEWLVDDSEPATAILSAGGPGSPGAYLSEGATRPQIQTGAEAEPRDLSYDSSERHSLSAHRAAQPRGAVATKTFDKRLLLAPVVLAGIVLAGFAGYRYLGPARGDAIASVAVLPFQNRSEDPDTDYLSDGIAESLIFRLTQLPGLKVSPTSSVIRYKGQNTDVAKIAAELGVDAVMTGRLMKRGDNLNISVELVDARNNQSLWGEQYERKMSDLLATQREIAATITQKLQLKLGGNDKGLTKTYTDNNEAYQLWMKGRFHFAKRTKIDMERSIELFQQATKLDPNFALAYVGIAESYSSMTSYPYISPKDAAPHSHAAIGRALELDPELPEAHAVAAMIATTYDWDYAKAEREFKRAIELGPNLAITHYRYGWIYLSALGRHDEAVTEMKRAMELEPLSIQQGANYAGTLIYARRFDDAVEQATKTNELDPNHVGAQNWLCHALNAKGLYEDVIAMGEKTSSTRDSGVTSLFACLGFAYAKSGQREKALATIAKAKEMEKSRYMGNYWIAVIHAGLGEKDAAFRELETAFRNRDWFIQRIKVDPYMDPLREDPRLNEFIEKLRFPE